MQVVALSNYQIYVGSIWEALNSYLQEHSYSKVAVLVDENTEEHCLPLLQKNIPTKDFHLIKIPSGEIHKNVKTCESIWQQMMQLGMGRHSLLINLGGGVIGDMGGFCASTFKRGMDFIQITTTLLAQVDASIGGKLGIDFNKVKNAVGLFKNPQAVFVDPVFLKTLSYQELRSGFAEIIKHGLIADVKLWNDLEGLTNLEELQMTDLIYRSLLVKLQVVEQDPFEKGLRKTLNFGHTIGHAIESHALESAAPLLHGEAIAIGMICEAWLSQNGAGLSAANLEKISRYFIALYGHVHLSEGSFEELVAVMRQDKKNRDKQINFTFITEPGTSVFDKTSSVEEIQQSLRYYNSLG